MLRKIAFVIGFAFPMYGYSVYGKQYFDLCTDVFIITILFLLLDMIATYTKDKCYMSMVIVGVLAVLYALIKEILGIGTKIVFTDKIMWVLIPLLLIIIPIFEIVNTLRKNGK